MKTDIELVPGVEWEPLFTPEEYEAFRQWWREHVVPELERLEEMHCF
jgi:hypothetical protein